MEIILKQIREGFNEGLLEIFGWASPFCPLYLLSAALYCAVWLVKSQRWTKKQAFRYFWEKHRVHRRSLASDGLWTLFQIVILRIPLALLHVAIFQLSYEAILDVGDGFPFTFHAPRLLETMIVTTLTMLAIDFAAYGTHRALHGFPGLWRIHRVHHQSRFLTPLATFRQHPLESVLLNSARGLAAGLMLGIVHIFLPSSTPVWTVAGMGIGFFAYMFTVNLHHAPIPIRFPRPFCTVLISPHVHHLHHSQAKEHAGKNFGVIFSFWDRIFGSYLDQDIGLDELEFGIDE